MEDFFKKGVPKMKLNLALVLSMFFVYPAFAERRTTLVVRDNRPVSQLTSPTQVRSMTISPYYTSLLNANQGNINVVLGSFTCGMSSPAGSEVHNLSWQLTSSEQVYSDLSVISMDI